MIKDYTGPKNRKHRAMRRKIRFALLWLALLAGAWILGAIAATLTCQLVQ